MTEERDPVLQALFVEARQELSSEEFTAQLMAKTQNMRYRIIGSGIFVAVLILVGAALFSLPLQEFALLVTQLLGTELISLGDSLVAWLILPINNLASLLVLSAKAMRMLWKKTRTASYAY
jgi:hypothetical protein